MEDHHQGIHHITAVAGDAQRNAEFYVKTLGMRMVKKSVNQDAPDTYHLFYANGEGSPGSDLTFFPWPALPQGKPGAGQAVIVSLAVPPQSKDFWPEHLADEGIDFDSAERFGKQMIRVNDPDGLQLELVFDERVKDLPGWSKSTVPAEYGIRGFRGTTLQLKEYKPTALVLQELFGFEQCDQHNRTRFYQTDAPIGSTIIIEESDQESSPGGRGTVHHVAFRAKDREEQMALREKVLNFGLHPTPVIDRHWFHSVYFQSPGGVLFEIATDGPGFAIDEDPEKLGEKLILTPSLESRRKEIEEGLPEIKLH
jgi:glyoxalase family protein